jgi:hypothetical protein
MRIQDIRAGVGKARPMRFRADVEGKDMHVCKNDVEVPKKNTKQEKSKCQNQ